MAGTSLQTLDAILKNQYLGPIREQFNKLTVLMDRLEKNDDSVVGKNFTIPLHYGRNEGIGSRKEGVALPTAGNQQYKECIVPMKYLYGSIELTGPTIAASKSNDGAFVRAVDSEMKGVMNDLKSSVNRQMWGNGTGILATCASAATNTITVDSTAKLRVGMPIDIILIADGTTSAGVVSTTVSSITSPTVFVAAAAPATPASIGATYGVFVAGSYGFEIMGMAGIFSQADPQTTGLQGLTVATYPWWKANSVAYAAKIETSIQKAIDTTEQLSNGKVTALYSSYGSRRAYQAELQAYKQYTNTMELKGGWKSLDYDGLPLFADKDAPAGQIFCADEDELQIYRLAPIDWINKKVA